MAATCKACGAPIKWLKMDSGKVMPVNEKIQYFVIADESGTAGRTATGYVPHWSTCPNADKFRRKK